MSEWAIRDEATGEYLLGGRPDWGPLSERLARYPQYVDACSALAMRINGQRVSWARDTARVVPAPPREMTDAECWEWFQTLNSGHYLGWNPYVKFWGVWSHGDNDALLGRGDTPCDAIRAARRKLEGK